MHIDVSPFPRGNVFTRIVVPLSGLPRSSRDNFVRYIPAVWVSRLFDLLPLIVQCDVKKKASYSIAYSTAAAWCVHCPLRAQLYRYLLEMMLVFAFKSSRFASKPI